MADVKNKRISDGVYEFNYRGHTTRIERRPDLYFDLELDGVKHKGYMKDLKAMYQKYIDSGTVEKPARATPSEPAAAAQQATVPAAEQDTSPLEPPQSPGPRRMLPQERPPSPQRLFPAAWWRKDKHTGKVTPERGIEVYARISHPRYEDRYPAPREAMKAATKEHPVENDYAFYWPQVQEMSAAEPPK